MFPGGRLRPASPPVDPIVAVFFDCDGVLVDSESLSALVLATMLGERGVALGETAALELLRGRQVATWIAELYSTFALAGPPARFQQDFRDRVSSAYRRHLRPEPHAQELLDGVEVPYSIVSNAPRWKISDGLACAGLDGSAARQYVSAYDLGSWKPEPTVYLAAAAGVDVPAARCLAVEDSDAGIRAAHAAGMRIIHYCRDEAIPTHPLASARSHSHLQTRAITANLATLGAAV
jgi:HAD superfamily hydrolase (TIGR01509 family)